MNTLRLLACSVAIALIALPASAASSSVPPSEQTKMAAVGARFAFVPSRLPPGVIFITWKTEQLLPMACGTNIHIQFAGGGRKIEWSSSRFCGGPSTQDMGHNSPGCYNDGYPGYGSIYGSITSAKLNGRRVYFSPGNDGSNAWACIPETLGGTKDMAVVGIWENNTLSPAEAMRLVAFARQAR